MQATVREVAEWCGAAETFNLSGRSDLLLSGVSTDTRQIQPGTAVCAARGERFDGHDYIADGDGNRAPRLALWDRSNADCRISTFR